MIEAYELVERSRSQPLDDIFRLRARAWKAREPAFPSELDAWSDSFDALSEHFALIHESQVVAASRLTFADSVVGGPDRDVYEQVGTEAEPPFAFISRLVVCPNHAGRGLPSILDQVRLDRARDAECRTLLAWTSAGDKRERQLLSYGFRPLYKTSHRTGPLTNIRSQTVLMLELFGRSAGVGR